MPRKQNFKECPKCGRTFNSLGLPNHRAHCKVAPRPEPLPDSPRPFPTTANETRANGVGIPLEGQKHGD